jgi:L-ascorbate metabolism protein UlaG (beta-lactamase superfamily)
MAREIKISWSNKQFTACWLGHSTVLLNYYGTWILTDPVFANTIGLDFGALGRIGLKRHAPLPIQVEELPPIDIVLISHAHLDHLDMQSLQALRNKRKTRVITSINTGSLIKNLHFRKVVELAWNYTFSVDNLQIKAFSTKHYGARTPLDLDFNDDKKNGMGYNSYLVTAEGKAGFFFMGDTGFTRRFKSKISDKIDLVLMPVGGYNPWEKDHVNPVQATRMAVDLGAKKIMPIHWGTFAVGNEGNSEPIDVLQEAVAGKQLEIVGIDRKPVIIKKSANKSKPIDDPWEYKTPANYGLNPRLLAEYLNHEITITQFISQEWHVAKPKQFRTALLGIRNMIKEMKYPPVIIDNVVICTRCKKAKRVRFYSHPNAPHSIALVCYECNNDLHNYYRLRPGGWELTKDEIVVDIEKTDPKPLLIVEKQGRI